MASGPAPHQWIKTATLLAPAIAGVTHFQADGLVDTDLQTLQMRKTQIDQTVFRFVSDSVQFTRGHDIAVGLLISRIQSLLLHASRIGSRLKIMIIGSTDSTGKETANRQLSQERADHVRSLLVAAGIPADFFQAAGKGTRVMRSTEKTEQDKSLNRSVSFQVHLPAHLLDTQLSEEQTQGASRP